MKILIFENSKKIAERLITVVYETVKDITFYKAGSYAEAVSLLRECNPDTVVLNLKYPGDRGVELLKKIKASNVKTVVIALLSEGDEFKQWKKSGADFIFDKTYVLRELL
ncbi:MAG: response regulator [Ginsengibacter sp.]